MHNLTELELAAVDSVVNVADGHARQAPTSSQQALIDRLPELFRQAAEAHAADLARAAQAAFLSVLGQHRALVDAEVLSCYSSSVAMEIVSRALHTEGVQRVALIHPTFDNIPDLLRGIGISLVAVSEEQLLDGLASVPVEVGAVFVTTPNNPTGRVLPRQQLAALARACAARGTVLIVDASFRGFDQRAQYDHYAVLGEAGCRYVVIEDTGKLWPMLDLKVGFLASGPVDPLPVRRIYTDVLLGVSPAILLLVQHLAEDAGTGGLAALHRFVAKNRSQLRGQLAEVGSVAFPDPDSRVSVERMLVPTSTTGTAMWHSLRRSGVHVLPCRQFHWADPEEGERFVRIALSRPGSIVSQAAAAIRAYAERS